MNYITLGQFINHWNHTGECFFNFLFFFLSQPAAPLDDGVYVVRAKVMQTAQREGMITMEKSIEDLIGTGVISSAEKNN